MALPQRDWRKIESIVRDRFGHEELRPGQTEALGAILQGRDTLAVLPTGAGKSAIYQIAALLIEGPTIVVSPLIALQIDQVEGIESNELATAAVLNSTQRAGEREEAFSRLENDELEFLLLAPEQLQKDETLERLRAARPSLFVVDEAHCISEWGHDFRPDYLRLGAVIEALGHPRVIALTATASPEVRNEIVTRLGMREPQIVVASFDRPNIRLVAQIHADEDSKRQAILQRLCESAKPGIVYAGTRKHTEELTAAIQKLGLRAAAYHAGMKACDRMESQRAFMANELDVIVATSAFGMGIDKPNVRYVYHYDLSDSLDAYYQEIGRAGRDGDPAEAVLFFTPRDSGLRHFLASSGKLHRDAINQVAEAVSSSEEPADPKEVAKRTSLSRQKVTKALTRLEDVGLVETLEDGRVQAPDAVADPELAIEAAVRGEEGRRNSDRDRVDKMRAYAELGTCRRAYLLAHFGEQIEAPCNNCDACERLTEARRHRTSKQDTVVETTELRRARDSDEPFQLGCRVVHERLGPGVVLAYEDEGRKVAISFDAAGERRLSVDVVRDQGLLRALGSA